MNRHHRYKNTDHEDGLIPAWIIDDVAPQEVERPMLEAPRPNEGPFDEAPATEEVAPGGRVIIIDI